MTLWMCLATRLLSWVYRGNFRRACGGTAAPYNESPILFEWISVLEGLGCVTLSVLSITDAMAFSYPDCNMIRTFIDATLLQWDCIYPLSPAWCQTSRVVLGSPDSEHQAVVSRVPSHLESHLAVNMLSLVRCWSPRRVHTSLDTG
jgi:hypothetical protein